MAAPAAVSPVGSALRNILRPVQMRRACPSVPGSAVYLYVVYKVTFGHKVQR